jgi:hypothetical protein
VTLAVVACGAVPHWSSFIRKVWDDSRHPHPLLHGQLFADEDDSGERSWEAHLIVRGELDLLEDECSVRLELDNDQALTGRAEVAEEELNAPPDEFRYLLRGSGTLRGFDWSVLS